MLRIFGPLIGLALLIVWVLTIANVIKTPDYRYRAGNQLVWLLVVILVPIIGVPLYWILGAPEPPGR